MNARRWGLALLSLGVVATHGVVASWFADQVSRLGEGSAPAIRRMDIAFVRELQASEPPAPAAAARPAPRAGSPAAAAAVVAAASAPQRTASAPDTEPPPAPEPVPDPAPALPLPPAVAEVAASAAAPAAAPGPAAVAAAPVPAAASAAATAFEWPPSTRLSYNLVGDYRGPVYGNARVEWLRRGDQYQVHLDVSMGAVVSRRMSSEGRLTDQGLQPRRYEEVTQALLRDTRRQEVRFEGDRVILATGVAVPALPGVQDTASQFVQLTWLFTMQADRLRVGQSVEVPLALPRRMDRWVYDVQEEEDVETPVGRIRAFHMVPRRLEVPQGELLVESWFAPSLQYLPVRMIIRQGAQAWVDLTLSRLPQQAETAAPPR